MFGKFGNTLKQLQLMRRLMKDEHVRAIMGHPKVQAVLQDPEFQALMKSQDMAKIAAHPKFSSLLRDPEFTALLAKLNPQALLGKDAA